MNGGMESLALERFFPTVLVLAGLGHFAVLGASFQVPFRLR